MPVEIFGKQNIPCVPSANPLKNFDRPWLQPPCVHTLKKNARDKVLDHVIAHPKCADCRGCLQLNRTTLNLIHIYNVVINLLCTRRKAKNFTASQPEIVTSRTTQPARLHSTTKYYPVLRCPRAALSPECYCLLLALFAIVVTV